MNFNIRIGRRRTHVFKPSFFGRKVLSSQFQTSLESLGVGPLMGGVYVQKSRHCMCFNTRTYSSTSIRRGG